MLLEKMVNPKAVLESPHVIAAKPPTIVNGKVVPHDPALPLPFDPIAYLVNVHRRAFHAVRRIWRIAPMKQFGPRMTESMLTIMKHIFKGERVIRERHAKRVASVAMANLAELAEFPGLTVNLTRFDPAMAGSPVYITASDDGTLTTTLTMAAANAAAAPVAPPPVAPIVQPPPAPPVAPAPAAAAAVNQSDLEHLIDMGFPPRACREALTLLTSVSQAADYILQVISYLFMIFVFTLNIIQRSIIVIIF